MSSARRTIRRHLETFERMVQQLAPYIDRCIFSFVEMYKKLETNMPELIPLTDADKERLAEGMGAVSGKYGIHLQTCGTNGDYSRYGIHASGCMTLDILGEPNGITSPTRPAGSLTNGEWERTAADNPRKSACPSAGKCVKIDKEMKGEMICVHFLFI